MGKETDLLKAVKENDKQKIQVELVINIIYFFIKNTGPKYTCDYII